MSSNTLKSLIRLELTSENTCINTKALKMNPFSSSVRWWQSSWPSIIGHSMPMMEVPANINVMHTMSWYVLTPIMFRHICLFTNGAVRPNGCRSIKRSEGGSVANAKAPIESMIMFTQSKGTAPRGNSSIPAHAAMRFKLTATTFTTN